MPRSDGALGVLWCWFVEGHDSHEASAGWLDSVNSTGFLFSNLASFICCQGGCVCFQVPAGTTLVVVTGSVPALRCVS